MTNSTEMQILSKRNQKSLSTDRVPPTLTVKELAKLLRVSPQVVYRMHRRRLIPGAQRVGRQIRFLTEEIYLWLRSGERP